ncbi:hypothetical protein ACFVHQ_06310 [Actinomycetes bacterium NPDC127524]
MELGKEKIFNEAFSEKGLGNVVLWDVQNIQDEQLVKISFVSKTSPYRQGVWLRTDKGIEIPALKSEVYKSISLWEDTSPEEVIIKCHTSDGKLSVYNIWDEGEGRESQADSSGMLILEKEGLLVYKCNAYGFETEFNDLIFSIEKL